jgi:hypothetical protein
MSEKHTKAQDKADAKAEAAAEAHDKAEAQSHAKAHPKPHDHGGLCLARAGNQVVNLAQFVKLTLPVEGDPKQPLEIALTNGNNLQLVGEDADAFLAVLGQHCDVAPCKKEKDAKELPA